MADLQPFLYIAVGTLNLTIHRREVWGGRLQTNILFAKELLLNSVAVNCGPLSDVMLLGNSTTANMYFNAVMVFDASVFYMSTSTDSWLCFIPMITTIPKNYY